MAVVAPAAAAFWAIAVTDGPEPAGRSRQLSGTHLETCGPLAPRADPAGLRGCLRIGVPPPQSRPKARDFPTLRFFNVYASILNEVLAADMAVRIWCLASTLRHTNDARRADDE